MPNVSKQKLAQQALQAGTYSNGHFFHKASYKLKRDEEIVGALQTYTTNATALVDGNYTGSQVAYTVNVSTSTPLTDILQNRMYQNQPATVLVPRPTWQYLLKGFDVDLYITNNTNAVQICELYDIMCRKDAAKDVAQDSPLDAWVTGYREQSGTLSTDITTYVGARPDDVPKFYTTFRTVNKNKFMLAPGGVHRHHFRGTINRAISADLLGSAYNLKNISYWPMLFAFGQPIYNKDVLDQKFGTTAQPGFVVVAVVKYYYYSIAYGKTHYATAVNNMNVTDVETHAADTYLVTNTQYAVNNQVDANVVP